MRIGQTFWVWWCAPVLHVTMVNTGSWWRTRSPSPPLPQICCVHFSVPAGQLFKVLCPKIISAAESPCFTGESYWNISTPITAHDFRSSGRYSKKENGNKNQCGVTFGPPFSRSFQPASSKHRPGNGAAHLPGSESGDSETPTFWSQQMRRLFHLLKS